MCVSVVLLVYTLDIIRFYKKEIKRERNLFSSPLVIV